jgi:orotidine-5'-phosphate decarboxylase
VAEVIVALDVPGRSAAEDLVHRLDRARFFKVGLELFVREGPAIVRDLQASDRSVFLDLKLHDIPNTVAAAAGAAAELGVEFLTLHAAGGSRMIAAARRAVEGTGTRLLAVTALTSMTAADLEEVWGSSGRSMELEVRRLADLALGSGAHGVVCSPHEAAFLRAQLGPKGLIVTPGIRLEGDSSDDQARPATPVAAKRAGADYLVVGRSITRAPEPRAALAAVLHQLEVG